MKSLKLGKALLPFLFIIQFGIYSCTSSENWIERKISIQDSIILNNIDIFRICVSVLPSKHNASDSLIWVYNMLDSSLYCMNTKNEVSLLKKISKGVPSYVSLIKGFKSNFIFFGSQNSAQLIDSTLSDKIFEFEFSNMDSFAYTVNHDIYFPAKDDELLVMKVSKLNLSKREEFDQYFNSPILGKATINNDGKIDYVPYEKIGFPEKYKKDSYADPYIQFCIDNNNDIFYTFYQWDSLAIYSSDASIHHFPIPEKFSVASLPVPDSMISSRTFKNEYFIENSSNIHIIDRKGKVYIFQKVAAKDYIKEDGTMEEFISMEKRLIVFDKKTKTFESEYYLLPPYCHPYKTFVFNDKLYIACQRDKNVVIYETDL